jgi:Pretoxin HINT domain
VTDVLGGEWDFENECVHRANVYAEDSIQDPEDRMPSPLLRIPVYNIEVEDFHTYFVGKEGVWVHNKNLSTAIKVQNDAYFNHPRLLKYHIGTTALATINSSA